MPLLYDRDCGFCRFSVALVLAWDRRRRLRPVAIQSEEGARLLAALSPEEGLASAHVVLPDGEVRSGGAAAGLVLQRLPGGALPARAVERMPSLSATVYDAIATRRSTLGRLVPARARRWADSLILRRQAR